MLSFEFQSDFITGVCVIRFSFARSLEIVFNDPRIKDFTLKKKNDLRSANPHSYTLLIDSDEPSVGSGLDTYPSISN